MARNKSKGYMIAAALVVAGAWFHETIMGWMHQMGIAKNHK